MYLVVVEMSGGKKGTPTRIVYEIRQPSPQYAKHHALQEARADHGHNFSKFRVTSCQKVR